MGSRISIHSGVKEKHINLTAKKKNKEEFQEFSLGGTPCLAPAGLFEGGKLIPGYNFLNLSILRLFQESPPIKLLLSARSELQIVGAGGYSCWFLVLPDWPLTKATQSKASPDLPAQLGCPQP